MAARWLVGWYAANSRGFHRRDLESAPWCYLLWCAPAALALATSWAYGASELSAARAGALWTLSVAWIGAGCFVNGRRCGRLHCRIDGILFPILAVVGALGTLSLIHVSWNDLWVAFFVILLLSFAAERIWGRYPGTAL